MLFFVGMGIGLMFFGVVELVMYFIILLVGELNIVQVVKEVMKLIFFYWGLYVWVIYVIVVLILVFFSYCYGLLLILCLVLYLLIGECIYGFIGYVVDIFVIIGIVFGVVILFGYGVLQINSGLYYLFGWLVNQIVQIVLIVVICGFVMFLVVSGLDCGICVLFELNLSLVVILLFFVLVFGLIVFFLQIYVQNIGVYLFDIVNKIFNLYVYEFIDWIGGWILLYWGWWLFWLFFVGLFIVCILCGCIICEFVCGVLFVLVGFILLWMMVFGDIVIYMVLQEGFIQLVEVVNQDSLVVLFVFFEYFLLGSVILLVVVLMVVVFFVILVDFGVLVVDMLVFSGKDYLLFWQWIFWLVLMGVVVIVLFFVDGFKVL